MFIYIYDIIYLQDATILYIHGHRTRTPTFSMNDGTLTLYA